MYSDIILLNFVLEGPIDKRIAIVWGNGPVLNR